MSDNAPNLGNVFSKEKDMFEEVIRKKEELEIDRVSVAHERLQERKNEYEKNKNINVRITTNEEIEQIQKENAEYLSDVKKIKTHPFINSDFNAAVPYTPKSCIFVGGLSGDGKSTVSANLAWASLQKGKHVLVISNEEMKGDIYNRITCLKQGWAYINHADFTDEQIKEMNRMIPIWAQRLKVITDIDGSTSEKAVGGQTTTIEGITAIFNSILSNNIKYDAIILDYYNNVDRSTKNPTLVNWQVQEMLAKYLNQAKNIIGCPIVVLGQLLPCGDGKKSFKERIEGRKYIYNISTCAIEIKAERELYRTSWKIHKSRFNQSVGKTIYTGFDRGSHIEYTSDFMNKVQNIIAKFEHEKLTGVNK